MNAEACRAAERRQEEMERLGGLAAYRLQALQHLKLKTVVKESHATQVHALAFNHTAPALGNLFATVGGDQATVYDGEHMGDHVGVVVHFTNTQTEHAPGGELHALAWLNAEGWSDHPAGDACLAVAGADVNISVISVVEAQVVRLLRGHTREVAELSAVPDAPRLLASLSRDGNLRLWDVPSETCLSSIQTDATCMALAPDAASLVIGNSKGKLYQYSVTRAGAVAAAGGSDAAGSAEQQAGIHEPSRCELTTQNSCHSDAIDSLRFLPGGRLATKSCDGRMFVWCLASSDGASSTTHTQLELRATWKIPSCSGSSGWQNRCQFGCTSDGRYIAAGSSKGDCFVYDCESGDRVGHVSAIRVSAPVRACGLSDDCRHLLAVLGKGFVFRFEYQGQLAAQPGAVQGEQEGKENTNAEQH